MNNIDLVKALHQIWNTGDLALIDSIYAQDFLAHWPPSSEVPERRGIEGIRFGVERIRTAFPDWHEEVIDVFGSGDRDRKSTRLNSSHVALSRMPSSA